METSAKTGFNAEELFVEAGKLLFEEGNKLNLQRSDSKEKFGIKLSGQNKEKNKKKEEEKPKEEEEEDMGFGDIFG